MIHFLPVAVGMFRRWTFQSLACRPHYIPARLPAQKTRELRHIARSVRFCHNGLVLKEVHVNKLMLPLLAVLLLAACGTDRSDSFPRAVSVDDAYALYQDGTYFLDVRTPEEWNEFHAPNSTLIPLDELENRLGEVPRDQPVVVVCRSGNRSQQGRDLLLDAGFTQVASMEGGLRDWNAAGYPITTGP
jgi:rhodanese-related sulfurtransferase